jgi:cytoskeletal protein RodZ
MADDDVTVGSLVARAREQAGLTIDQVAQSTRVRATVIRAIEQDDFRLCGGDVYARGHLKSIATAVGLDPAAVAAQFDADRGRAAAAPVADDAEPAAASRGPVPIRSSAPVKDTAGGVSLGALAAPLGADVEGRRGGTNWTAVMALALAVIVVVGVLSVLNNRGSSTPVAGPSQPATSTSATPTTEPTPTSSATEEPQPTSSPTDAVAEADGVKVVLDVTGKAAWVRVTGGKGKETLFEGTLTKGDTKTFKDDDQINLIIGDAGAVTLDVNGQDLGAPGSRGQVVKLEFVPGDPTGQAG